MAIHHGCQPGLDEPTRSSDKSRVDHLPLSSVHMVDEKDNRPSREQSGPEGQPVADIHDHHVWFCDSCSDETSRVYGQTAAGAFMPDAINDLDGGRTRVTGRANRHVMSALHQLAGEGLDIPLRATRLRMTHISPGEEEDLHVNSGRQRGLAGTREVARRCDPVPASPVDLRVPGCRVR